MLTYNYVEGFPDGIHGDGRLVVVSSEQGYHPEKEAPSVLHRLMHEIYNRDGFENVDMVYVYSGLNAMDQAMHAAANLVGRSRVTLVGCNCRQSKKEHFARNNGIEFILSECGGRSTLGRIAKEILNGEK
jgi:hypothetical protein